MEQTAVTTPTNQDSYDETIRLRSQLAEINNKTLQLGQAVLELYVQGEFEHDDLIPFCDHLLALEQALAGPSILSDTATDSPIPEEPTDSPIPDEPPGPPDDSTIANQLTDTLVDLHVPDLLTDTLLASPARNTPSDSAPLTEIEGKTAGNHFINCPQCQSQVQADNKFCTTCGYQLSMTEPPPPPPAANKFCQRCKHPLIPDTTYCTTCGEPVQSDMPAPGLIQTQMIESITKYCLNCGKGLSQEITVCPECQYTKFDSL